MQPALMNEQRAEVGYANEHGQQVLQRKGFIGLVFEFLSWKSVAGLEPDGPAWHIVRSKSNDFRR